MPNPSSKSFKFAFIEKKGCGCCSYETHDKVCNILRKSKMLEGHFDEALLKAIISLFKVNFHYHVSVLTLPSFQRVN